MGAKHVWIACPYCNDATNLTIGSRGAVISCCSGGLVHVSGIHSGYLEQDETLRVECNSCTTTFTVDHVGYCTRVIDPEGQFREMFPEEYADRAPPKKFEEYTHEELVATRDEIGALIDGNPDDDLGTVLSSAFGVLSALCRKNNL